MQKTANLYLMQKAAKLKKTANLLKTANLFLVQKMGVTEVPRWRAVSSGNMSYKCQNLVKCLSSKCQENVKCQKVVKCL